MKLHPNAQTTPHIRALMVRRVLQQAKPAKDTAEAFGVSVRTVHKWVRRYRSARADLRYSWAGMYPKPAPESPLPQNSKPSPDEMRK